MRVELWAILCMVTFGVVQAVAQTAFIDFTGNAGIDHHHYGFKYGGGAACGDFDKDGNLDIFVPDGRGKRNLLFMNRGDGTFDDLAATAGVADTLEGFGAVAGDVDNDGDLDIYVTNHFDPNKLYLNNGDATFVDATEQAKVGDPGPSSSSAMVDYDNDGDLDIYVLNRSTLTDFSSTFYRNNGDGTFSDVTRETGTRFHGGISLGVGFFDYDNDGDQDLYIADEFRLDGFFRNDISDGGRFTDIFAKTGIPRSDGMGIDFCDYDRDGDLDIFIGNFYEDLLLRNDGNDTFSEVAISAGIENNGIGWGVNFFDYDNDGDSDLYVVNGSMTFTTIAAENNVFYKNNGDGTFEDIQRDFSTIGDDGDGRGSVCADFNRDGYVDIFMVNVMRGKSKLYLNRGGNNNWLTLDLEGTVSNRSAVGARVELEAGDLALIDEVRAGSSYASMHPLELEFGLGLRTQVDKITIRWPSGLVETLENVPVNQVLHLVEGSTVTSVDESEQALPADFALEQNYPNPFNPHTMVRYTLSKPAHIGLAIYNMTGQLIRVLDTGFRAAGAYELQWNATNERGEAVASGIYLMRLSISEESGTTELSRKMMLMR